MVYQWEQHRAECLELYINQDKPLSEIIDHFEKKHDFTPSKRAFQQQFQKWGFPAKHVPAWKDPVVVGRVKELWERNLNQGEMLQALHDQGFPLSYKDLKTLRTRNGWKLRAESSRADDSPTPVDPLADRDAQSGVEDQLAADDPTDRSPTNSNKFWAGLAPIQPTTEEGWPLPQPLMSIEERGFPGYGESDEFTTVSHDPLGNGAPPPASEPGVLENRPRRRSSRLARQPADKRGRRQRYKADGLGGGVARFPSEMGLDDARNALGLDVPAYSRIRERFMRLCEEQQVVKKSLAGRRQWDALLTHLRNTSAELQHLPAHHPETTGGTSRKRAADPMKKALDVICTDVTKRIRMKLAGPRTTMAAARTALGLNPQEAREARAAFEEVLVDAGFSAASCMTDRDWAALRTRWAARSDKVRDILETKEADAGDGGLADRRRRMLLLLARDVVKRIKDVARRSAQPSSASAEPPPSSAMEAPAAADASPGGGSGGGGEAWEEALGAGDALSLEEQGLGADAFAFAPAEDGLNQSFAMSLREYNMLFWGQDEPYGTMPADLAFGPGDDARSGA